MKIIQILIFNGFLLISLTHAQTMSDISQTDVNYKEIKNIVKKGQLNLYNNDEFKPNIAVTRRELAIILNQLNHSQQATSSSLNNEKITNLNLLADSFKETYTANENKLYNLSTINNELLENQKILFHENTKLNQEINSLKEESKSLKKQRKLLYILVGFSSILGFVFP